jgi:hypothetical protein
MTIDNREPVYDVVWPLAPAAAPVATLADHVGDLSGKIVGQLYINNHIQGACQQEG